MTQALLCMLCGISYTCHFKTVAAPQHFNKFFSRVWYLPQEICTRCHLWSSYRDTGFNFIYEYCMCRCFFVVSQQMCPQHAPTCKWSGPCVVKLHRISLRRIALYVPLYLKVSRLSMKEAVLSCWQITRFYPNVLKVIEWCLIAGSKTLSDT